MCQAACLGPLLGATFRRMQQPERPLGLGILAVASLSPAMWNVYAAVMLFLLVTGRMHMPEQPEMSAAYEAIPVWLRWFLLVSAVAKASLLVVAGVGYFGRRRFGRLAGSAYAVLSIAESIVAVIVYGGVGRDSVIGVLFAGYTLLAVNSMYREQLTR